MNVDIRDKSGNSAGRSRPLILVLEVPGRVGGWTGELDNADVPAAVAVVAKRE